MILIVEDSPENLNTYRASVKLVQEQMGDTTIIASATTFEEAMGFFSAERAAKGEIPELVIVDMEIPIRGHKDPRAGFRLIDQVRERFPHTRWIPITAHVQLSQIELEDGRRLLDALYGVSSWGIFFKDQHKNLASMLRRFFDLRAEQKENRRVGKENQELQDIPLHYREEFNGHIFVTRQWELYREIRSVAANGRDVLLFGEHGTGKRLVARMIHHRSDRNEKRFEAVDGEVAPDDCETLLFPQVMDAVQGGTLYIRSMVKLPLEIQRLLRHFRRYKGYDVRLIGGVGESRRTFRDYNCILGDFFDSMIPLDLPPLRERKEDIPVLVEVFLEQFNREHKEHKKIQEAKGQEWRPKVLVGRPEIYKLLQAQDWREGNIAQLRRVVEEVLLKSPADEVTVDDFQRVVEATTPSPSPLEPEGKGWEPVERRASKPTRIITEEDIKRLGL